MLVITAIVSAVSLLAWIGFQSAWARRFARLYRAQRRFVPAERLPRVGVMMSLRGADPLLANSLRGLLTQDYPHHQIRIIVDSEADPAHAVVRSVLQELQHPAHVTCEVLTDPPDTCALKVAGLLQASRGFTNDPEVFAWLDADTVPQSRWLHDLVAPLCLEAGVAAACGVRWYEPPDHGIANHIRHIWNAAALIQMVVFQIGWGGAFAIRRHVFEQTRTADLWKQAMSDDVTVSNVLRSQGYPLRYVTEATMVNRETTSLAGCQRFITRQIQLVRLNHQAWPTLCLFGLAGTLGFFGVLLTGALGLWLDNQAAAAIAWSAAAVHGLAGAVLMLRAEGWVRRRLRETQPVPLRFSPITGLAAVAAQVVYLVALCQAIRPRLIEWRGIRYRIRGSARITRLNHPPYVAAGSSPAASL